MAARQARREAERDGSQSLVFAEELLAESDNPAVTRILVGERKLFALRREALLGQKAQLRERIGQLGDEIVGLREQTEAKAEEIRLAQQELTSVRELWRKNLVPLSRITALERDGARLKGERGRLVATTAETKGKISELQLQTLQIDQNLRSDVSKELSEVRAKSAEAAE